MSVKRYELLDLSSCDGPRAMVNEYYEGEYVRFADYEQLQRRAERAEELARSLAAEVERLQSTVECGLELADAVENKEDLKPAKFALRCLMLVARIRKLAGASLPLIEVEEYDCPPPPAPRLSLGKHPDWPCPQADCEYPLGTCRSCR